MSPICVILLPDRVGIFTDNNLICQYVRERGGQGLQWVENEKLAHNIIFEKYSVEELFLLGIDDTDEMLKNQWYRPPHDIDRD